MRKNKNYNECQFRSFIKNHKNHISRMSTMIETPPTRPNPTPQPVPEPQPVPTPIPQPLPTPEPQPVPTPEPQPIPQAK
jgi:outer membrane biosynthesis protein TonB